MTLRHLSVFICVCDEGNMTAAAEKLYIAQPSVSQSISELERYYNVKLFERLGRKLFITPAGQKLLTYARYIVNLNSEAAHAMRNLSNSGVLRIGASVTVGTYTLNDIIKEFEVICPEVKIISSVDNTKVIEAMLLQDQVDIGLVEGKIHSQELIYEPFMEDELVLVCAVSHPWAQKLRITLAELNNMEFIVREEGSGTRELFETVMSANDVKWEIKGVHNNAESIKNAVKAGFGVTIISRMAIQAEIKRNELVTVEIDEISFQRKFGIVFHKNKYISTLINKFVGLCRVTRLS